MDVNGTRFHYFREEEDWSHTVEVGVPETSPPADGTSGPTSWVDAEWSPARRAVGLTREVFRFGEPPTPSSDDAPLTPEGRFGAAADPHGSIYWIGPDGKTVWRRTLNGDAEAYWDVAEDLRRAAAESGAVGVGSGFRPVSVGQAPEVALRGLTVTSHHYLVVGNEAGPGELLVLDLHAGGPGVRHAWRGTGPFRPWDMDPAPGGGFWVLERARADTSPPAPTRLWLVDRAFRVAGPDEPAALAPRMHADDVQGDTFQPESGDGAGSPLRAFPGPFEVPEAGAAVSVAGLPDGTLLVLDSPEGAEASRVLRYRGEEQLDELDLTDVVRIDTDGGASSASPPDADGLASVFGYDMAWIPAVDDVECSPSTASTTRGRLVVVESTGNQAFAWDIDWSTRAPFTPLDSPTEYLPLRRYDGGELVVRGGYALYGFRDRWIEIRPIHRPRYARRATLETQVLDGREAGCVWHRVAVDGCVPPGTEIVVEARSADDDGEVALAEWVTHRLYRRGDGSELPVHRRFIPDPRPDEGTWETLLQEIEGRYAQFRLKLSGTGRATPRVDGVRIHYPRFSYLHRYLPDIYREDPGPASFGDRFLANFEGLLTTWEGRIAGIHRYFDPDAAPAEALEWLAGWLGVVLDPVWREDQRRLFLNYAAELYRWRGTPLGIEVAVRLYLDESPGDDLFDGRRRLRSSVRVVERFRTRQWAPDPADPTASGAAPGDVLLPLTRELVEDSAHRFVVLVPADLTDEQLAMARRIVELEKPAHTDFRLDFLWALFRVGGARIGLDTELRDGARFRPAIIGREPNLGAVHLTGAHPFGVTDRVVPERDAYGDAPPL